MTTRTERELNARDTLLMKRMHAEGNRTDFITALYGSNDLRSPDGRLLMSSLKAIKQLRSLKHTTKGDFCHLHSGRNEVR